MNATTPADPAGVTAPVVRALDSLILGAAVSFLVSVAAVYATVFAIEGHAHAVAHLLLPGVMLAMIAARALQYVLRRPLPHADPWGRARAVNAFDARLAQVLSIAVPAAWLVGGAAILIRHGDAFHDLAVGIGLWLPLAALLWITATFAWIDACRDRISSGLDESDRSFRAYWRDIARPR